MDEKTLKSLRSSIDSIDDQLLKLIVQRTAVVDKIGVLKKNSDSVIQ